MAHRASPLKLAPENEDDGVVVSRKKLGELVKEIERLRKEVEKEEREIVGSLLRASRLCYWGDSTTSEEIEQKFETKMLRGALRSPLRIFSRPEIEDIAKWKSRKQFFGKVEREVRSNSPQRVRAVTKRAFEEDDPATAIDLLAKLDKLKGVGYPVASAILMFHDPRRYTVLDKNAWRALFRLGRVSDAKPPPYSGKIYHQYLKECMSLCREWGIKSLRDTDRLLLMLGA